MIGGKWTTFRAFGEQAADRIFRRLGVSRMSDTRRRYYPGAEGMATAGGRRAIVSKLCKSFSQERASVLVARYGAVALEVAAFCQEAADVMISSIPEFTEREVRWLIERRAALLLDDLLLRRTQIVLDGQCSEAVIRDLGLLLAKVRGLDVAWAEQEINRCLAMPSIIPQGHKRPQALEVRHG